MCGDEIVEVRSIFGFPQLRNLIRERYEGQKQEEKEGEMESGGPDPQQVLDLVGLDLREKCMRILGALLRAASDPEGYRCFKDIYQSFMETEETREVPRNTVYEALSTLERRHFIRIDRARHRHRYLADSETISTAMDDLLSESVDRRLSNLSGLISPEEERLRDLMEDASLGERTSAGLQGKHFKSEPRLATEIGQIETLVRTEVLAKCRKGDTVRVFFESLEGHMLDERSTIAVGEFLSSGCDARVMLHSEPCLERDSAGKLKSAFQAALKSKQSLVVKLRTSRTKTYEIVASGSRGIVLVISREPLIATYVTRSANRTLVDHAIETFDKEFSKAKPIFGTSEKDGG